MASHKYSATHSNAFVTESGILIKMKKYKKVRHSSFYLKRYRLSSNNEILQSGDSVSYPQTKKLSLPATMKTLGHGWDWGWLQLSLYHQPKCKETLCLILVYAHFHLELPTQVHDK